MLFSLGLKPILVVIKVQKMASVQLGCVCETVYHVKGYFASASLGISAQVPTSVFHSIA
jgi:hypothetical protein